MLLSVQALGSILQYISVSETVPPRKATVSAKAKKKNPIRLCSNNKVISSRKNYDRRKGGGHVTMFSSRKVAEGGCSVVGWVSSRSPLFIGHFLPTVIIDSFNQGRVLPYCNRDNTHHATLMKYSF